MYVAFTGREIACSKYIAALWIFFFLMLRVPGLARMHIFFFLINKLLHASCKKHLPMTALMIRSNFVYTYFKENVKKQKPLIEELIFCRMMALKQNRLWKPQELYSSRHKNLF